MTLYRSVLIVDDDLPLRMALADYMAARCLIPALSGTR